MDILEKYNKHKMFSNISIILLSIFFAFGINTFLINGTSLGQNLKSSILESKIQDIKSDIYLKEINGNIYLISSKNISNLKTLSLALTYNPENIEIKSINSEFGDLVNLSNTPGISSLILTMDNVKINSGDKILEINIIKKENKTETLNVLNANFKDSNNNKLLLTTSGITF